MQSEQSLLVPWLELLLLYMFYEANVKLDDLAQACGSSSMLPMLWFGTLRFDHIIRSAC